MRGAKWLREADYLTDADRALVMESVERAKLCFPEHARTVGVRPPAYIGEPHPIATVDYGPTRLIFESVYRPR